MYEERAAALVRVHYRLGSILNFMRLFVQVRLVFFLVYIR